MFNTCFKMSLICCRNVSVRKKIIFKFLFIKSKLKQKKTAKKQTNYKNKTKQKK